MVCEAGGLLQGGGDVSGLQEGAAGADFVGGGVGGAQVRDVGYADAGGAQAKAASALVRVGGDAVRFGHRCALGRVGWFER